MKRLPIKLLAPPPSINKCKTCEYHSNSNSKCLYYRKLLGGRYLSDYYDQVCSQQFATEKDAITIHESRSDSRLCGPYARHYRKEI